MKFVAKPSAGEEIVVPSSPSLTDQNNGDFIHQPSTSGNEHNYANKISPEHAKITKKKKTPTSKFTKNKKNGCTKNLKKKIGQAQKNLQN